MESFDSAIGELYRELAPLLVRYAEGILGSRSDAEEAVQDAFLAASRAGRLEEPRPWLFRVTRNAAIDQLRRRRHLRLLEDGNGDRSVSAATDPHLRAELTAELEVLRRGLDRLGEQQRSALVLRELSGLGYREIASVLEVSEANVKVLIFRARRSLQEFALATRLSCDAAQLALSARADGEAGRTEAARARLHTASCSRCREFAGAVREQRIGLGMLVPVAGGHGVAAAAVHAVVGAKAGGGLGGLFGLKAAATAAVVVVFSTGAVVAVHDGVGSRHGGHGHPPLVPASGGGHTVAPVDGPQPGARVEDGSGVRDSSSGDGSGDGRGEASGDGSSGGSDSQTSDGGGSSGSDSQTSDGGGGDQSGQVQGSSGGESTSSGSTSGGDGGGSSSGDG